MTRARFVRPGRSPLTGRAWSGRAPVTRVEVSTDGGATWADAPSSRRRTPRPWAWRALDVRAGRPQPGAYELLARATDATGDTQPVEPPWNRQGMANNMVQRVPVTVLA